MKIAVLSFSGNVGKSTIARHLLRPRIGGELVAIESINTVSAVDRVIKARQFGTLSEDVMLADSIVVDVGASNVEAFVREMQQHVGSWEDFDAYVVPCTPDEKQQIDTMATIDQLASMGVSSQKIAVLLNRVGADVDIDEAFAPLLAFHEAKASFRLDRRAVVRENEVYRLLMAEGGIEALIADETDYRALARQEPDRERKLELIARVTTRRLALGARDNLDQAFAALGLGREVAA